MSCSWVMCPGSRTCWTFPSRTLTRRPPSARGGILGLWRRPCAGVRRISGLSRLLGRFRTTVATKFLYLSLCLLLGDLVQPRGVSSSTCTRSQGIGTVGRLELVSPKSSPPGTPCSRPRTGTCACAWLVHPCRRKWSGVSSSGILTSTWHRMGPASLWLTPISLRMGAFAWAVEDEIRELSKLSRGISEGAAVASF
jgi:hypothetical protein